MSKLSDAHRAALGAASISSICNILLGHGFGNVWIRHVVPVSQREGGNMVGPAYTLRFIPAREDIDSLATYARDDNLHRRAVEECPSGSVLVIGAGGDTEAASAGDMMIARMKVRGCAGIVTDGGFRDTPDIARLGFPAYHRTAAPPASPTRLHPADLNVPIGCGGVAIYPGDVIVGDGCGVVVIPAAYVERVAMAVGDIAAYEEFVQARISAGQSLFGLFPATEASRKEFETWRTSRDGAASGPI